MGLISIASSNSVWRGLDYYKEKKINKYEKISETEYKGKAKGSYNREYNIFIDIDHPRKSHCDCPHAKGKRIICKHMIALYFAAFPSEVENFLEEAEKNEKEAELYEKELYNKTVKHIQSMSKKELEKSLIDILNIAPDWIYERFIRDNVGF